MTDAERLKVAQEVLESFEFHETICACGGEEPYSDYVNPPAREVYDAAHKPGCRWMVAMGKRDA